MTSQYNIGRTEAHHMQPTDAVASGQSEIEIIQ